MKKTISVWMLRLDRISTNTLELIPGVLLIAGGSLVIGLAVA